MFASHVTIAGICYFPFRITKGVPDRWAFAIAVMRAFYLKRGCGDTPLEVLREMVTRDGHGAHVQSS
jgi:hypothetical protein